MTGNGSPESYVAPTVVRLGSVAELTKSGGTNDNIDFTNGQGWNWSAYSGAKR